VLADAVADGLMARAGAGSGDDKPAGAELGADEPLADWERELLARNTDTAAATADELAVAGGVSPAEAPADGAVDTASEADSTGDTEPAETEQANTVPSDTASAETAAADTASADAASADTTSADTTSADTATANTATEDGSSADSAPADTDEAADATLQEPIGDQLPDSAVEATVEAVEAGEAGNGTVNVDVAQADRS
jgi:small subunit ribosomal protein S2